MHEINDVSCILSTVPFVAYVMVSLIAEFSTGIMDWNVELDFLLESGNCYNTGRTEDIVTQLTCSIDSFLKFIATCQMSHTHLISWGLGEH